MEKKPDFEAMLKNGAFKSHPLNLEKDAVRIDFAEERLEEIWTDYVTPLQSQLSEAEKMKK